MMQPTDLVPGRTYWFATDTDTPAVVYQGPHYEAEGVESGRLLFEYVDSGKVRKFIPTELKRLHEDPHEAFAVTRQCMEMITSRHYPTPAVKGA